MSDATSARSRWIKRLLWGVPAATLAAVLLGLIWWWTPPGGLDAWKQGPPPDSWSAMQRQRQDTGGRVQFTYRPLGQVSTDLQVAVIVAEDINFLGHGGIDPAAIREAVQEWREGQRLRGASTISQQLARNLFLTNERSWLRKLREAKLARWLEAELGKRRILELYVNVIEFGNGVLGVEAAAQRYYGTGADRLTADQAAGLAAAIPGPHVSNPATATRAWNNRRDIIAARMRQVDWLRRRLADLR